MGSSTECGSLWAIFDLGTRAWKGIPGRGYSTHEQQRQEATWSVPGTAHDAVWLSFRVWRRGKQERKRKSEVCAFIWVRSPVVGTRPGPGMAWVGLSGSEQSAREQCPKAQHLYDPSFAILFI